MWDYFETKSQKNLNCYDCIIGRDLVKTLGIHLIFSEGMMMWDDIRVPMADFNMVKKV